MAGKKTGRYSGRAIGHLKRPFALSDYNDTKTMPLSVQGNFLLFAFIIYVSIILLLF
jgi:hypothetical protein